MPSCIHGNLILSLNCKDNTQSTYKVVFFLIIELGNYLYCYKLASIIIEDLMPLHIVTNRAECFAVLEVHGSNPLAEVSGFTSLCTRTSRESSEVS